MTTHAWTLLVAFSAVLLLLALPLGRYIAAVMEGRLAFAARVEGPLYRLCGVEPDAEMGWLPYTLALLLFNGIGFLAVYALQRLQLWLPLNPQGLANVSARFLVQHRDQLRHQHQLAGLRRRDDDELPDADARPRRCRTSSRPRPASSSSSR